MSKNKEERCHRRSAVTEHMQRMSPPSAFAVCEQNLGVLAPVAMWQRRARSKPGGGAATDGLCIDWRHVETVGLGVTRVCVELNEHGGRGIIGLAWLAEARNSLVKGEMVVSEYGIASKVWAA